MSCIYFNNGKKQNLVDINRIADQRNLKCDFFPKDVKDEVFVRIDPKTITIWKDPPALQRRVAILEKRVEQIEGLLLLKNKHQNKNKKIRVGIFYEKAKQIKSLENRGLIQNFFKSLPVKFSENFIIEHITALEVKNGILSKKEIDLFIMPGGDAEDKCFHLGAKGRENLTNFIANGGGYLGICAGAYVGLTPQNDDDPELKKLWTKDKNNKKKTVLDGPTKKWHFGFIDGVTSCDLKNWCRGNGRVELEFSEDGKKIFGTDRDGSSVYYCNGAIMRILEDSKFNPKLKVLATYKSEVWRKVESKGKMINSPAIVVSEFGPKNGRVASVSPHLEKYKDDINRKYLLNLMIWLSKSNNTLF